MPRWWSRGSSRQPGTEGSQAGPPPGAPVFGPGELASAFELLLGAPLGGFDPGLNYVVYHENSQLSSEVVKRLDPYAVLRREPTVLPDRHDSDAAFNWRRWAFDLGASYFVIDEDVRLGSDAADAALRARSGRTWSDNLVIVGTDLAKLLIDHQFDPRELYEDEVSVDLLARVHTDGTLYGAMRAATWTDGSGPLLKFRRHQDQDDHLFFHSDSDDPLVVKRRWAEALQHIQHPHLREHLAMLCLTGRSASDADSGAKYLGPNCSADDLGDLDWLVKQPGTRVIAGWEYDDGPVAVLAVG